MIVNKSEENKQYYEYLKFSQNKNLKIFDIVSKAKVLQSDTLKNKNTIDSLKKEIDKVIVEKNNFISELSSKNPNTFTSHIIKSYILPDFEDFKKKNPNTKYKDKNEFLGDHFFDYINFNDTLLLYTDVFYNACNNYIRNFVSADSNGYKKAIDVVLTKSAASPKVNKYFLDLFIETFEESSWEDVFTYLVDNYYLQSYCEDDDLKAKDLKNKTEILKKLAIGNKAPEIKLKNENDTPFSLYNSKSNLVLLFFWKSSCEYCEESVPKLQKLYTSYKSNGFEIISISIDTVQTKWMEALKKHDMKWITLCDFQGYKSPVAKEYYVWRTPTFYLLDKDKKIISKPVSVDQIENKLKKTFNYFNADKNTK
jgi:peroxiredoxin